MLKDALEERIKCVLASDHPILAWLVEFGAVLVNRYEVGHDGKTPYERSRCKKSKLLGLEFGELLNFRRTRAPGKLAKLECLWEDGVFFGYRSNSGEVIVGTKEGVFRTRTVQRKMEEQRWDPKNLELVGGVPWRTSPDQGEVVMPAISMPMLSEDKIDRPIVQESEYVPRRLYIKKTDIETHGMTAGCRGCLATMRGTGGAMHSEECRKRITEEVNQTEDGRDSVRQAKIRTQHFEERATKARRIEEPDAGQVQGTTAASSSSSGTPLTISVSTSTTKRFRDGDPEVEGRKELAAKILRRSSERWEPTRDAKARGEGDMEVEGIECLEVQCEGHNVSYEYLDSHDG